MSEILRTNELRMVIYTICDHPSDFPDHFTIRRELIAQDNPVPVKDMEYLSLHETLDSARKEMESNGFSRFPATVNDDPVIVESWL